jgi:hypothetical protein
MLHVPGYPTALVIQHMPQGEVLAAARACLESDGPPADDKSIHLQFDTTSHGALPVFCTDWIVCADLDDLIPFGTHDHIAYVIGEETEKREMECLEL